jgi:hypothetical protein
MQVQQASPENSVLQTLRSHNTLHAYKLHTGRVSDGAGSHEVEHLYAAVSKSE